jgi:hypothetical protein
MPRREKSISLSCERERRHDERGYPKPGVRVRKRRFHQLCPLKVEIAGGVPITAGAPIAMLGVILVTFGQSHVIGAGHDHDDTPPDRSSVA